MQINIIWALIACAVSFTLGVIQGVEYMRQRNLEEASDEKFS